jgi:hypothetical protein
MFLWRLVVGFLFELLSRVGLQLSSLTLWCCWGRIRGSYDCKRVAWGRMPLKGARKWEGRWFEHRRVCRKSWKIWSGYELQLTRSQLWKGRMTAHNLYPIRKSLISSATLFKKQSLYKISQMFWKQETNLSKNATKLNLFSYNTKGYSKGVA